MKSLASLNRPELIFMLKEGRMLNENLTMSHVTHVFNQVLQLPFFILGSCHFSFWAAAIFHFGGTKSCDMANTGFDIWEKWAILQNMFFTSSSTRSWSCQLTIV